MPSPPDNTTIHAALYNATTGRPNRPAIESLFQAYTASINGFTGVSANWGTIGGTLSAQADLQTALNGKAALVHTHTLAQITDAGSAAGKSVAASGDASTTQVVLGSDSRLTNARTPTAHTHPQSDVTNLPADIATAKADPIEWHIESPSAKSYLLSRKAQVAGTILGIDHNCGGGSLTFSVQINGVTVTGLSGLTSGSSLVASNATGANAYAAGATITLLVASVSTASDFAFTLRRTRT